jgi:Trk-type K+ transport system membrane component
MSSILSHLLLMFFRSKFKRINHPLGIGYIELFLHFADKIINQAYHSSILMNKFILWNFTLFFCWFVLLKWTPDHMAFDALFDATSALSNVSLSTGLTGPDLPLGGKIVLMFLMWLGRLEIIPVIILTLSLFLSIKKKRPNGANT